MVPPIVLLLVDVILYGRGVWEVWEEEVVCPEVPSNEREKEEFVILTMSNLFESAIAGEISYGQNERVPQNNIFPNKKGRHFQGDFRQNFPLLPS